MTAFQILDWDSCFFGFSVAKVVPVRLDEAGLSACLRQMKAAGVSLAYWSCDPQDEASREAALRFGGFLADRKVTFAAPAGRILASGLPKEAVGLLVEEYAGAVVSPELEGLALQAGAFSRFKIDRRMPAGAFEELYRLWIRGAVAGTIADKVFVVRESGKEVGMLTVGVKGGRADIGLIAVDDSLRGRGAGTALVLAARDWGAGRGIAEAQVVTQRDNEPACRFYEKCGYSVDKVEHVYH